MCNKLRRRFVKKLNFLVLCSIVKWNENVLLVFKNLVKSRFVCTYELMSAEKKVFETLNVLINLKVRENALLMSLCVETDWKLSKKVCICDCSKLELLYFVSLLKNCIWRGSLILKLRFFCKFVVVCKKVRMDVVTMGLLSFVLTNNVYNWQRTYEDALKACVIL